MEFEKKSKTSLSSNPFFILEVKNIFTVTNIMKSEENSWLTILNFIDSESTILKNYIHHRQSFNYL